MSDHDLVYPAGSIDLDRIGGQCETRLALLFHTRHNKLEVITAHRAIKGRTRPMLSPGRLMTPEDEAAILALLTKPGGVSALRLIPEHLLYHDARTLVWHAPSRVAPMQLATEDGVAVIQTRWPSMVFMARDRELAVVALPDAARPTLDTPVFHCPLPNIYSSTSVCMGSAKLPVGNGDESIPLWEAAFFGSAFTHENHRQAITPNVPAKGKRKTVKRPGWPVSADPMEAWATRHGDDTAFPAANLTPLECSLGEWINGLDKGGF